MSPPDPAGRLAHDLLDCLDARLALHDVPVCRSFLYSGASVSWDVCGRASDGSEGQAWVAVQSVTPTDAFPSPAPPHRCPPAEYAAEMIVGLLRCAATVDDQGRPPDPAALTDEFDRVGRDRAILREAILCCLADDLEPGEWQLGSWTPLGPQGGCVGGQQVVTVRAPACRCSE